MDNEHYERLAVAPETFDILKAELVQRYDAMPKRLKQVASFALNQPDELALGTTAAIAVHAGVQPSTLVRFAQALGYKGFSELQAVFRARLRQRMPDHWDGVKELRQADGSGEGRLIDGFIGAAHQSLDRLRAHLADDDLRRMVKILAGARTIHLLAARRVFPVSAYLAYALGSLGISAHLVDQTGALGPEQLAAAFGDDVVLAVSYTPYAATTVEFAAGAAARGIPVVSITDSPFSPLVPISTVWVEVAETDFGAFRSLSATFALIMALAVAIADHRAAK